MTLGGNAVQNAHIEDNGLVGARRTRDSIRITVERVPRAAPKSAPARNVRPTSVGPDPQPRRLLPGARRLPTGAAQPATLESILRPITPQEFRAVYYGQRPLHVPGSLDKFQRLFSWDSLNNILNSAPDPHPKLRLYRGGSWIQCSDSIDVVCQVQQGATLVLDAVDRYDTAVRMLARGLACEIGEDVQVNLYVSQPGMAGFVRHYDTTDVFLLQTAGSKAWRIYQPTIKRPITIMAGHLRNGAEEEALNCTLRTGDVLYIPRGFWHEGLAESETSAHLTVGIHARTGIDYLSWLVDELRSEEGWRQELPMVFQNEAEADRDSGALAKHLARLHQLLERALADPELTSRYDHFSAVSRRSGAEVSYPQRFAPRPIADVRGRRLRRSPHQSPWLAASQSSSEVQLTVGNTMVTLGAGSEGLIRRLFATETVEGDELLREFGDALGSENVISVCSCLVAEGIIEMIEARA